ncbi:MAG: acyltransferase [Pseudomonadota bacterium]
MPVNVFEQLRGVANVSLMFVNTVFWFLPILVGTAFKLVLPFNPFNRWLSRFLVWCAESWIGVNRWIMATLMGVRVEMTGDDDLRLERWYLVIANHQSWIDVLALQYVFNRRIPFLKFFIKRQLRWIPFLGQAWWALDMPFMQRYSKSYLVKHPEKRGTDFETTRRACEKFKEIPTSVINFVEGTRATPEKIAARRSSYRHLLPPRSGGIAFAIAAMGEILHRLVDVTVFYPEGKRRFWDLCCGRISRIIVDVQLSELPGWVHSGDYANDREFRQRFQRWLADIWEEKDRRLKAMAIRYGANPALDEAA